MLEAWAYETAARLMFGPITGLTEIRREVLGACVLGARTRVLEVGCGPGSLTKVMLDRGAHVTAVDASAAMLSVARRRAPSATFHLGDVLTFAPDGRFDVIVASFILHELPPLAVPGLVARLANALPPNGRVVLVDHAMPAHGVMRSVWSAVLRLVETPTIDGWLAIQPETLLTNAGLQVRDDRPLAHGRARLVVGQR